MRDHDARALAHHATKALEDLGFGVGVDGRERVVEDEDARVLRDRACDRRPLLLAAGQRHAALADHRVVPRREVLDVLAELRHLAGPIELTLGQRLLTAESDVLAKRDREEEGLLGHVAHGAARTGSG